MQNVPRRVVSSVIARLTGSIHELIVQSSDHGAQDDAAQPGTRVGVERNMTQKRERIRSGDAGGEAVPVCAVGLAAEDGGELHLASIREAHMQGVIQWSPVVDLHDPQRHTCSVRHLVVKSNEGLQDIPVATHATVTGEIPALTAEQLGLTEEFEDRDSLDDADDAGLRKPGPE